MFQKLHLGVFYTLVKFLHLTNVKKRSKIKSKTNLTCSLNYYSEIIIYCSIGVLSIGVLSISVLSRPILRYNMST